MNRKDLFSLMEAYDEITLDREVAPEDEIVPSDESEDLEPIDTEFEGEHDLGVDEEQMEDNEHEKRRMVDAHLHTLRSHAHEIYTCIENGANIEPWMEEKIALANDYIVHVANAIMYRK